MNRLLREIIEAKRQDLSSILAESIFPEEQLKGIEFRNALIHASASSFICEVKKASPSEGVICENFDPSQIAKSYKEGGAAALSVLTDVRFFQGASENVALAKEASGLPVLCKDFFIDPRQVSWAKRLGADAVLLIMRALSDSQAQEINAACIEIGLDVLVETHCEEDIERALILGADLIGVNNRDLDTFEVSLDVSERLRSYIPDSALAISESGIKTADDVTRLEKCGYAAFLVGSSLMRADDKAKALRELRGEEV